VTLNGGEIALVVECSRKIRVSVDARCRLEDIEVCPLMASDRSLPPITTVAVQKPSASAQAVLHVAVVDNHPPGAYYGVLLDRRAARPAGAISVVLE
jgi:hypothetical protein